MMVMVMLVVILANWKTIKRKISKPKATVTEAKTDPEASSGQIGSDLSGFLFEDGFFDETAEETELVVESGKKVSFLMESVQGDLRITVIDSFGKLASGEKFVVDVEGEGTYTDENEDGVIYIDRLAEGQYFVSMKEAEGYIVPTTKTMINISNDIEYKALSDVAYLIFDEEEIDVSIDDTEDKLAVNEADGSESIELDTYKTSGKLGIDVSSYNREIDWEKVAESDIDYAIIRCGYRGATSGSLILDSYFKDNCRQAMKADIPIGIYFFSQAMNVTEAIEEASMVIEQCRLYMIDYPIFVNSESAGGAGRADDLSKDERTEIIRAFCQTIENSGYEAGVYASENWWKNHLDSERLTEYHTWLAQYKEEPDYEGFYDFWQYTSKGTVEGIETKVDLNISYE